jgi:hypothetical protein
MIEHVEGRDSEFERLRFSRGDIFLNSNAKIVEARAINESPPVPIWPRAGRLSSAVLKAGFPFRGLVLICKWPGVKSGVSRGHISKEL